jgi:hypothetical protein
MTPWSLFRIGSVSKTVTAAAILRLYQEGRLSIDATVFGASGEDYTAFTQSLNLLNQRSAPAV